MRKRTINHLADTIFWYILYFLPVIAYLLFLFIEPGSSPTIVNIESFFGSMGLSFVTDNIIVNTLTGIFGPNGVLPLFQDGSVILILAYYVSVFIMHLAVDFLLFIPRLCHKWLKAFTQGE